MISLGIKSCYLNAAAVPAVEMSAVALVVEGLTSGHGHVKGTEKAHGQLQVCFF